MAVIKTSDQEFHNYVNQHEKLAVKFFANWCGTCKLLAPKFRRISEEDEFNDVTFLDVNAEENPEARKWAGVTNLPFFAVVKNGEIVTKDYTGKEEGIRELLEAVKN